MKQFRYVPSFITAVTFFFAAILLLTVMGCKPKPTEETTGEYVDDTVLTAKVKAAIVGEASLKSDEISVQTVKGSVQLTGTANSQTEIDRATTVAQTINGVKDVKNDVHLK